MKKNSEDDSDDSGDLQEPHDSDDDVTVDGDSFFLRTTKTIMYAEIIQMVFLGCVIHLTLNPMIYQKQIIRIILQLVLLKIKKTFKFAQLLMMPMKILKLELKLHMVDEILNLLYQEVVYFLKLHIYWLENVMNFMGPSQKRTLSRGSVLQPYALHFHYFILKVPCFLQFFG